MGNRRTKLLRISVLLLSNFSLFVSIHKPISLTQSSIVDLQIDKSSKDDVQRTNITAYHPHKNFDKTGNKILQCHLMGMYTMNIANGPARNLEELHKVSHSHERKHLGF